jgi:hypothetical protein
MLALDVDHATVAWSDLAELRDAYASVGLPAEYGGTHSNGRTHMDTLGFSDGSYLELISTLEGESPPFWADHIRDDGGTCAWAVRVEDATEAAATLRDRGTTVEGPVALERERPDGEVAAWELIFLGEGDPGAVLPFLIADETPRERRVTPTDVAIEAGLRGIERVVLGVTDLSDAVARFETAFDVSNPEYSHDKELGARVASFPEEPLAIAAPGDGTEGESHLADRLSTYGPSPCAVEFAIDSTVDPLAHLTPLETGTLLGRKVAWVGPGDAQGLGRVAIPL